MQTLETVWVGGLDNTFLQVTAGSDSVELWRWFQWAESATAEYSAQQVTQLVHNLLGQLPHGMVWLEPFGLWLSPAETVVLCRMMLTAAVPLWVAQEEAEPQG